MSIKIDSLSIIFLNALSCKAFHDLRYAVAQDMIQYYIKQSYTEKEV